MRQTSNHEVNCRFANLLPLEGWIIIMGQTISLTEIPSSTGTEFAVVQGIDNEPAFNWEGGKHVLKK